VHDIRDLFPSFEKVVPNPSTDSPHDDGREAYAVHALELLEELEGDGFGSDLEPSFRHFLLGNPPFIMVVAVQRLLCGFVRSLDGKGKVGEELLAEILFNVLWNGVLVLVELADFFEEKIEETVAICNPMMESA
jgi:hypothetical protein